MQAVVVHFRTFSVFFVEFLAEIMQQVFTSGHRCFGICHHVLQQCGSYLLFGKGLADEEFFHLFDVLVAVKCQTVAFAAVASCAAGFLIVALKALGYVMVYNETHVRFVYAHSESYGGNYHVHIFHKECILVLRACFCVQSGVVRCGGNTVHFQEFGKFLHFLTR